MKAMKVQTIVFGLGALTYLFLGRLFGKVTIVQHHSLTFSGVRMATLPSLTARHMSAHSMRSSNGYDEGYN